ncbi:MAG: hypothetical protein WEE53_09270 [Acidimicrobiia bacterium]
MTFDDHEREQLRRGLAVLVDETPVAPELASITAVRVRAVASRRRPITVFITAGAAVVIALGGVALLQAGESGEGIEGGEPTNPTLAVSTTAGSVPAPSPGEVHRVVSSSPGWAISYLERDGNLEGGSGEFQHTMIQFTNGSNQAELNLNVGGTDLASLIADREADGTRIDDATVLGTQAVVVRYDGEDYYTAMGRIGEVVYEFVAGLDESAFRSLLTSLSFVDNEEWNAALPDTVVTDRSQAVVEFLADIPLPPGFDTTSLEVGPEEHWYQVGADMVGAVTCAWIDQWVAAKATQDQTAIDQAVDALGTSREWGILTEMSAEGDFSKGVWEYADAIAGDGTVRAGMVLTVEESYQQALGCPSQ